MYPRDNEAAKQGDEKLSKSTGRIILARHGETVSNREGFVMGRSDSSLTREGIRMAEAIARLLAAEDITAAFASPLGRAMASARIYTSGLGFGLEIREAMAELSCGEWEGRSRREVTAADSVLRPTWEYRPPGGESYEDGEIRVRGFVEELRRRAAQGIVLVVGHASVNRVFLRLWLNLDKEVATRIVCPHDTVYLLDEASSPQAWSVDGGKAQGLLLETDRLSRR
jgi:broad specificity phosphatase PhoE